MTRILVVVMGNFVKYFVVDVGRLIDIELWVVKVGWDGKSGVDEKNLLLWLIAGCGWLAKLTFRIMFSSVLFA